ncbi:hypothetical protein [Acidovorax sp. SRB_24]|nr:hypothetical protein [Acidovorax sp. SRB_24]
MLLQLPFPHRAVARFLAAPLLLHAGPSKQTRRLGWQMWIRWIFMVF